MKNLIHPFNGSIDVLNKVVLADLNCINNSIKTIKNGGNI